MSRLVEVARRASILRRSTCILFLALSLTVPAAWIVRFMVVDPSPSVSSILAEAEIRRISLLATYDANELARVSTYVRALLAIDRARILARGTRPDLAIPHAQSALALLEQTDSDVLRARFNQLEATVIALQLSLPIEKTNEVETVEAEVFLRDAQDAARQGNWETALSLVEHVVTLYRAQGAALEASN